MVSSVGFPGTHVNNLAELHSDSLGYGQVGGEFFLCLQFELSSTESGQNCLLSCGIGGWIFGSGDIVAVCAGLFTEEPLSMNRARLCRIGCLAGNNWVGLVQLLCT